MRIVLFLIVSFILIISSCKSSDELNLNKPLVVKVNTILIESSKGTQENGATSIIEFEVFFDKTDLTDINSMIFKSSEGSIWSFDKNTIKEKLNNEEAMLYFDTLTSSLHKDHIPLGEYSLTVNYDRHSSLEYNFSVYGRGNVEMHSGRIYTEASTENPKILATPDDYSAYIENNLLFLEFTSTDEIINDGYIWVYNEEKNCIAVEGWFSEAQSINSTGNNRYSFNVEEYKSNAKFIELVLYSNTTTMNDKTIYWCRTGAFPIIAKE